MDFEKEQCTNTLEALVGVPVIEIEPLFKESDKNGDGILFKDEVMEQYGRMALMRSKSTPKPPAPPVVFGWGK